MTLSDYDKARLPLRSGPGCLPRLPLSSCSQLLALPLYLPIYVISMYLILLPFSPSLDSELYRAMLTLSLLFRFQQTTSMKARLFRWSSELTILMCAFGSLSFASAMVPFLAAETPY
jgi:hypothetical protein